MSTFFSLLSDFLPKQQHNPPSYNQEQMGGPGSWIFIFKLFNILKIKMLIIILQDEIYFCGLADVNYENGWIKLSLCLH